MCSRNGDVDFHGCVPEMETLMIKCPVDGVVLAIHRLTCAVLHHILFYSIMFLNNQFLYKLNNLFVILVYDASVRYSATK